MKIVVVGGGAMGIVHAAKLTAAADVSLLVRRRDQAEAINARGVVVVEVDGNRSPARMAASHTPELLADADLVLVAVKSYHTADVADLLAASGNSRSVVLSIQNGLAHNDVYAETCGHERVLLGKTGYAASREDDTTVVVTHVGATVFGERDGSMTDRVTAWEGLFRKAGVAAEASPHAESVVWSKFAQACCQNALGAITRRPFAQLRERQPARDLLADLSIEMTDLAMAEGVSLLFNPEEQLLKNWNGLHHRSSMLQDLDSGRRTEVDALNGEAVRRGALHGLPMHANQALWRLVRTAE